MTHRLRFIKRKEYVEGVFGGALDKPLNEGYREIKVLQMEIEKEDILFTENYKKHPKDYSARITKTYMWVDVPTEEEW